MAKVTAFFIENKRDKIIKIGIGLRNIKIGVRRWETRFTLNP